MAAPEGRLAIEADRAALTEHGLRVTRTRLAVLQALARTPHADAEQLHLAIAQGGTKISLQSVHNVLSDLQRVGLIRRFEPARAPARFERSADDHHHHAVCERCGRVEDIDREPSSPLDLDADPPDGFSVRSAELTFWGVCSVCAADTDTDTETRDSARARGGRALQ